jgi:hypothetical protein
MDPVPQVVQVTRWDVVLIAGWLGVMAGLIGPELVAWWLG